jgi:hypothetical protein
MNLDPKTRKVTAGDITKLIPNATKDMVTLLLSQANNAGKLVGITYQKRLQIYVFISNL